MLGAILCNLPYFSNSGPFHGQPPGNTAHGTGWNTNWAVDYGPLRDKAEKATAKDIEQAVSVIAEAQDAPEFVADAQDVISSFSLASDLMNDRDSVITVMMAYYWFIRWKKQEEEAAALLLLM